MGGGWELGVGCGSALAAFDSVVGFASASGAPFWLSLVLALVLALHLALPLALCLTSRLVFCLCSGSPATSHRAASDQGRSFGAEDAFALFVRVRACARVQVTVQLNRTQQSGGAGTGGEAKGLWRIAFRVILVSENWVGMNACEGFQR
jgi:hypothetical protein